MFSPSTILHTAAIEPAEEGHGETSRTAFALLLLVNVIVFLRPSDVVASLEKWPVYDFAVAMCAVASLLTAGGREALQAVARNDIFKCVAIITACAFISNLLNGGLLADSVMMLKVAVYFVLLKANVSTVERFRALLGALGGAIGGIVVLSLLQYYGYISIDALAQMAQVQDEDVDFSTGKPIVLLRLCGAGLFANPNDLARILIVGAFIALYFACGHASGVPRWLWLGFVGLLLYAVSLTYSRGALVGMVFGACILIIARFGKIRGFGISVLVLGAIIIGFAGRQTDITVEDESAQHRIEFWRDGFQEIRHEPLLGVGMNKYFADIPGGSAHNSFLHEYVELGLIGGTAFSGMFYLSLIGGIGGSCLNCDEKSNEVMAMRPYVLALTGAYAVGLLTSSRNYVVPTFTVVGLAAVYADLSKEIGAGIRLAEGRRAVLGVVLASAAILVGHVVFLHLIP